MGTIKKALRVARGHEKRHECTHCHKSYTRIYDLQAHLGREHAPIPVRYYCDVCGKEFKLQQSKKNNEKAHFQHACPRNSCYKLFNTVEESLEHAIDASHLEQKLYECLVPNCRLTVIGKVMDETTVKKHYQMHVQQKHVSRTSDPDYKLAQQPSFKTIPILGDILVNNASLRLEAARHEKTSPKDKDEKSDNDKGDEGGDESLNSDEHEHEEQIFVPEDEEVNILVQNQQYWILNKDHFVCTNARGYICAGPGLNSKHFIYERCPSNTTIDFDTALLRRSRGRRLPTLSLDSRCADCHSEMRIRALIKKFDSPKLNVESGMETLRNTFSKSISKAWTCTEDYKKKVKLAVQKSRLHGHSGPRILILDIEFSPTTHELYEVAIIDRFSGDILLNTLIKHTKTMADKRTQGKVVDLITYLHKKKVYAQGRCLGEMTVDQVADNLQQLTVTLETMFITWHTSKNDLHILRKFLVDGGYPGILSKNQPCYPMIPLFRKNFRTMCFPLNLEIIFPVMYPDSHLRGRNHRAWVDCEQTRLVCDAFDALLDPITKRTDEWLPDKFASRSQCSIRDYFLQK